MSSVIKHPGVVEEVKNDTVFVKILNVSACSSCHAKGACSAADMQEKIIEVKILGREFVKGQSVTIISSEAKGFLALFWGYLAPFLLVFISLVILTTYNIPEIKAGLLSLSALIPYYGALFLFKNKLRKKFTFDIQ